MVLMEPEHIILSYAGTEAKTIGNLFLMNNNLSPTELLLVERWLGEPRNVILYALDGYKSYAFVSKMDFDPLNVHLNPYVLEFVYTPEIHRRCGYAKTLLRYLKNKLETTAFCSNDESIALFNSAGFAYHINGVFRYP